MKDFKNKWYYRFMKIIFYIIYVLGFIIGVGVMLTLIETNPLEGFFISIFILPIFILFIEILRSLFYYIVFGIWDFKNRMLGITKFLIKDKKIIGITLKQFIFYIVIIFFIVFSLALTMEKYYSYSIIGEVFIYFLFLITFLFSVYILFKRFNIIGKSGYNVLLLFIPIYNIYLTYQLFFNKSENKINKKFKEENSFIIILLFVIISILVLSFIYYNNNKRISENYIQDKIENNKYHKELNLDKLKKDIKEKHIIEYNKFIEGYSIDDIKKGVYSSKKDFIDELVKHDDICFNRVIGSGRTLKGMIDIYYSNYHNDCIIVWDFYNSKNYTISSLINLGDISQNGLNENEIKEYFIKNKDFNIYKKSNYIGRINLFLDLITN